VEKETDEIPSRCFFRPLLDWRRDGRRERKKAEQLAELKTT